MNRMNSLTCLIKSVFRTRSLTNQTNLFVQMNHSSQHYYFVTVLHGCQHHLISTLCELANYRPISNLPFTSIFFWKSSVCSTVLLLAKKWYLWRIWVRFQARHSTETALVKITNDLLLASHCYSFSAAFDSIDQGSASKFGIGPQIHFATKWHART